MLNPMVVSLAYPGHDAKMYVAALTPLAFNFLHKALTSNKVKDYIYMGLVVGFMILSSHIQTTYFALWLLFFYLIFFLIIEYKKNKQVSTVSKKFGLFWMGMFLGVIIGAVQLLPPYLYAKEFSIRGTESKTSFEHAISWGMHPEEAFSLIVPEFSGTNRTSHVQTQEGYKEALESGGNSYWGRNPFKLNTEYPGFVILFISILALFFYKGKRKKEIWFFFGSGIFFLLYSLVNHTPLFYLAYKIIPGVNLFRGQSMILFLFSFVLAIMTAMLIDNFIAKNEDEDGDNKKNNNLKRNLLITGIGFFGIMIIKAVMLDTSMSIYQTFFGQVKLPDASFLSIIKTNMIFTGIFSLLTSIGLYLYLIKKITVLHLTIIISLLIFVDTTRVNTHFIKTNDITKMGIKFSENKLIKEIKNQYSKGEIFRVLNLGLYGLNEPGIHGIETVRGFHDNELKWYRKFRGINSAGVNTDVNLTYNLKQGHENTFLNIVGAKYILTKTKEGKPNIIPNKNFMPRAFIVSSYEIIDDEDNIVTRLKESSFDYRNKIILEKEIAGDYKLSNNTKATGKVLSYEYKGNNLFVEVDMQEDGLLFMSDSYMPNFKVIDVNNNDKELELYKANLAFRAVPLHKGKKKLKITFESKPYMYGKYLSLLGLLIGFVTVVYNRFVVKRK